MPVVGDLVGRVDELERLEGLIDRVERGAAGVVLVTGDAGIGKSALLDALTRRAARRGFTAVVGRCAPRGSPPYWPWPRVLRSLGGREDEVVAATVGDRAGLFAAAADRLEAACASAPVIVVIDDLQWADESSLALGAFLVAASAGLPIGLAFGLRDEPAEMTPALLDALAALPADVERLPLAGLDPPSTAELLESVLGRDPPPEMVDELQARTGGNPLFVKECGRLFAGSGASASAVVPEGVRQVITRRLARLSRRAYTALAAAAVADDFDLDLLTALTAMPGADVAAGISEGREERLVVPDEEGQRFAHELIRQTLLDTQSTGSRTELHRRAASRLEAELVDAPVDGRSGLAERAAVHWSLVPIDGRPRAARLAVEAARSALGQLGYDHAARLYRWARDLGDDTLDTLTELGEALVLAGQLDRARQTLAIAATRAESERRGDALARAVLAAGSGVGGYEVDVRDEQQVVRLHDALSWLDDGDSRLRAAALARVALIDATLPQERRAALAEEAAAMAGRLGDTGGEVAALAARCDILAGPDHVEDRLVTTASMVALASRQRDPVVQLVARRHRLLVLLERGDLASVDDEIAACARTSDHLRVPLYSWIVPLWRGMRALMDGDPGRAAEHCAAAEALGRVAESDNADVLTFTLRFSIARVEGSTGALDDEVGRVLSGYEGYPAADGMLAVHKLLTGDQDGARTVLHRRMAAGLEAIPRDSEWLETLWNLTEVAVATGETAAAEVLHEALVPYAHLWVVDGIGAACFGSVSDALGRLSTALDRRAEAREWLQAAEEAHAAAGAHHLAASCAARHESLDRATAPPLPEPPGESGELVRDGPVWHVTWQGTTAAVRHSKGVLDIARLLERPGRELHVLDLMDAGGPAPVTGGVGPLLDDDARRAYKRRLDELDEDIADAANRFDEGHLARLEQERDLLIAELAGAFGLGGRARPARDPEERARKAVGMRIATAVRAITAVHPSLGRHLGRSVVTGRYCSYQPETEADWTVRR